MTTLAAPRYSDRPFPRYRFIPGEFPHPTAHPLGHSYHAPGQEPPQVRFVEPPCWRDSIDYMFGCDLYNYGFWWEAHESWEGLWRLTDRRGLQGRFLQGLIQVSACHLKFHLGHLDGVERLRRSSTQHLLFVLQHYNEPSFMGLNVRNWLDRVGEYYDQRCGSPQRSPGHDSDSYPYLQLDQEPGGLRA